MGRLGHVLTLSLACGAASSALETQVVTMAQDAISDRCSADGFIGDFDAVDDREEMEATLGGNNFVLEILTEASSPDDAESLAIEYARNDGFSLVRRRMVGFAMFGLMLLLFPCFCLTACPCCVRCRACRPKSDSRSTGVVVKLVGLCAVGAVGAGILVCWGFAWEAHAKISDGVDNLGCTSAKLAHAALEGQDSPEFIGMNNMVAEFQGMADVLDTSSAFMMQLNRILDQTEDIATSVQLASQTLDLLLDMLSLAENSKPGGFHTCELCAAMGEPLASAAGALEASLGTALAQARSEVKEQLNEANREEMKRMLSDAVQPTVDAKEAVTEAFEPLVNAQSWDNVQLAVGTVGLGTAMLLVAQAAVLAAIGFLAMCCFVVKEGNHVGGYNRAVHRSACCVWMFAWVLCLSCFLWGGVLELLAVPLSSTCLVLDDVNGDMIRDIRSTLDLSIDPASDNFVILTDVVDKCLNPVDPSVAANLADIFFFRDENGTKITMREQLQTQLEGSIVSKFDEVEHMISEKVESDLENEPFVVSLRSTLSISGPNVSGTIVTDQAAIQGSGEDWVASLPVGWPGYYSSVRCDDYESVPGVATFIAMEDTVRPNQTFNFPNPPCSGIGDGTTVGADCLPTESRCLANNFLLDKKLNVMSESIFRCDVFETDAGDACDMIDMRQSNNTWANDCRRDDGTLKRKEVTCTLEEFSDYLAGFDERIQKTMARVDVTTAATADQINGEMRNLVEAHIVSPINDIVDGIQCNWLSAYYQETVWGVCYQGVVGLNRIGAVYVALGLLLVLLIAIMYALWRRAVDNVKLRDSLLR
jgi:hypothetical protein